MKHAGAAALDDLEPLLGRVRTIEGLKERRRGVFYKGTKAFLHFHEDAEGYFADARTNGDWRRFGLRSKTERERLLAAVRQAVEEAG